MNWQWEELEECASTFDVARQRGAWCVVRTRRQAHGRGRFNRTWFGEPGGMWATFNVALEGERPWGLLPLVAGVAIMRALASYNIPGLRLRWPNDVLVGRAKLAGILVERPTATIGAIGIGLNMFNDVQSLAGRVQDPPVRLADLVPACPEVPQFAEHLAACIFAVFTEFLQGGFAALQPELRQAWGQPRPVEAQTDHGCICGDFLGVQADGSPILRGADGSQIVIPGISVNRMRELS